MHATLLIADAGQATDGKLYLLGAGLKQIQPGSPFAVALILTLEASETTRPHAWRLELRDVDGRPVSLPGAEGGLRLEGELNVQAPGIEAGDEVSAPMVVNFSPLPLPPGRYTWTLTVDGATEEAWQVLFSVPQAPVGMHQH